MVFPRIETCCFIFDLRTGNIILGSINATLSFIFTVYMIVITTQTDFVKHGEAKNDTDTGKTHESKFADNYAMCVAMILIYLIKFIFDVIFIYGVVKSRLSTLKSYFIMATVLLGISIISFIWNIGKFGVSTIFAEIVYIGVNIYVILLSSSFYQQLKSTQIA